MLRMEEMERNLRAANRIVPYHVELLMYSVCSVYLFAMCHMPYAVCLMRYALYLSPFAADNVAYGFDPHDDSDYLTIEGNDVWGNGTWRTRNGKEQKSVNRQQSATQSTCQGRGSSLVRLV